jgi:hypothetical protein
LPTSSLPRYSRISEQLTNRVCLRDGPGYITSREKRKLTNKFPEYEIRAYIQQRNDWADHIFDSISWTAYRLAISALIENVRTFVIKLSHNWLPVGVRERRCGAATGTCPKCIQPETVPHLYLCHSRTTWRDQFIAQLAKNLKDASTAADRRYTIVNGIHKWILTDDTYVPDEPDPTTKLGWFQVIITSGAEHKRFSSELKDLTQDTIQVND